MRSFISENISIKLMLLNIQECLGMLYSVINTKLRDFYSSLETLCEDMNIDENTLKEKLSSAGFEYNKERNQFI